MLVLVLQDNQENQVQPKYRVQENAKIVPLIYDLVSHLLCAVQVAACATS
jgi:hypothetical protein